MLLTIYAHSSKESNYEHARKAGIEGEALNRAMFLGYELTLEYEVNPLTGIGDLVAVDGRELMPREVSLKPTDDKANLSSGTPRGARPRDDRRPSIDVKLEEYLMANMIVNAPTTYRDRVEAIESAFRAGHEQGYILGIKAHRHMMRVNLGLSEREDVFPT